MFKILLFLVCFEFAFSLDATMEIIKNKSALPTISVVAATDSSKVRSLDAKLLKLIEKDLQVSCHFNDAPITIDSEFIQRPQYKLLSENGIDLYLVFNVG